MYKLPEIKNEDIFEDLCLDIFNVIEKTNTFKKFGRKGHKQKGIDVFSSEKDIVIQCKKKDLTRKESTVRKELKDDIESDLEKIKSNELRIVFKKIYFLSTYKNHPEIDEFCETTKEKNNLEYEVIYWGWDTIERIISENTIVLEKYYPQFMVKSLKEDEVLLKRNLDLKRRIEKDFEGLIDYRSEDRKQNTEMIIRAYNKNDYPYDNEKNEFGEYSWFKVEFHKIYYNGIEFLYGSGEKIVVYEDNSWNFESEKDKDKKTRVISAFQVGQLSFSEIVDYDLKGDEFTFIPHFYCKFKYEGLPFENTYYMNVNKNDYPIYFKKENKRSR